MVNLQNEEHAETHRPDREVWNPRAGGQRWIARSDEDFEWHHHRGRWVFAVDALCERAINVVRTPRRSLEDHGYLGMLLTGSGT
ncbi:hypothetical protein ACX83E_00140 [Burkholderia pseudomallei]